MIVGNGLIANLFKNEDRENVVFFASGVSNSLETEKSAFLREENLLRKTLEENPEKIFIYFSTCSTPVTTSMVVLCSGSRVMP